MKYLRYPNIIFLVFVVLSASRLLVGCGALNGNVLDKICLEGHTYWSNGDPATNNFAFAPILTDDGKPVSCNQKEKK